MVLEIDCSELKQLLADDKVVLIDVREVEEFEAGHIAEALLMPLSTFPQCFKRNDFPQDKIIVLQCRSGARSMNACQFVGQDDVVNLKGGILAWQAAGYLVEA